MMFAPLFSRFIPRSFSHLLLARRGSGTGWPHYLVWPHYIAHQELRTTIEVELLVHSFHLLACLLPLLLLHFHQLVVLSPLLQAPPSRILSMSRPTHHRHHDGADDASTMTSVCTICQHSPRGPLVTQCRHCFCGPCIKALLENASMRPIDCPVCRSPIFDASELCSPSASAASSSLGGEEAETRCTNQAHGCSWRGGARDSGAASLSEHLSSTCMHHPCSNRGRGCSWVGSVGAAIIHQATECEIDIGNERQASSSTKSDVDNKAASCRADKLVRAMLSSRVFAIDVGHRTFRATERTLRAEKGSVLDRMFSGEYELPRDSYHLGFIDHDHDDDGDDVETNRHRRERRVFIDCDPRSFEHVLHWLRAYVSLLLISSNRSLCLLILIDWLMSLSDLCVIPS